MNPIDQLRHEISLCTDCDLRAGCQAPVPGSGDAGARVMLVGEAPGIFEDHQGEPFVGQAGVELGHRYLPAAGLDRKYGMFLTNVNKCRPPHNETPTDEQVEACRKWLDREIELIQPKVIIAAGVTAARRLIGEGYRHDEGRGVPHLLKVGG